MGYLPPGSLEAAFGAAADPDERHPSQLGDQCQVVVSSESDEHDKGQNPINDDKIPDTLDAENKPSFFDGKTIQLKCCLSCVLKYWSANGILFFEVLVSQWYILLTGFVTKNKTTNNQGCGADATGANTMPQPGQQLLRRRSKGPALTRPATSTPLEPVSRPKEVLFDENVQAVNPLEQLALVELWQGSVICFLGMFGVLSIHFEFGLFRT